MFIRDHLAVVSHWAQDQLERGAESRAQGLRLQQLIEAAEALREEMTHLPANIVPTDERRAH